MKCPNCSSIDDKVIETRLIDSGVSIRRRRECNTCGYRFTSYENIEEKRLMIVKRDKRREPFSREKLYSGVQKAVEKRPISQKVIDELINTVEEQAMIRSGDSQEISSSVIGDLVMEELAKIDSVAYVRFASVYRHFNDINEFIKEIESIKK